jgi:hypothetical protein
MLGEGSGMRVDGHLLILCLKQRILQCVTFITASTRRKLGVQAYNFEFRKEFLEKE